MQGLRKALQDQGAGEIITRFVEYEWVVYFENLSVGGDQYLLDVTGYGQSEEDAIYNLITRIQLATEHNEFIIIDGRKFKIQNGRLVSK